MKPGIWVLARLPNAESLWWVATAVFLAAFAVLWAMSLIDPRLLDGASRWAKPMKFSIATALHFGTLALVVHYLSGEWQARRALLGATAPLPPHQARSAVPEARLSS